jgi:hypothetical protein
MTIIAVDPSALAYAALRIGALEDRVRAASSAAGRSAVGWRLAALDDQLPPHGRESPSAGPVTPLRPRWGHWPPLCAGRRWTTTRPTELRRRHPPSDHRDVGPAGLADDR